MEKNKSPFEEIFKKEEGREEEEKKEKEKGILDALDDQEKSFFEASSPVEGGMLEKAGEKGENISKEKRYRKLINDLLDKKYFEEAINLINEMKAELK
jgi:hypothetical protein